VGWSALPASTSLAASGACPANNFGGDPYSFANKYLETNPVDGWASLSTVINILKKSPELNGVKPLDVKNAVEKVFTEKFGPKEAAKPKVKVRVDAL